MAQRWASDCLSANLQRSFDVNIDEEDTPTKRAKVRSIRKKFGPSTPEIRRIVAQTTAGSERQPAGRLCLGPVASASSTPNALLQRVRAGRLPAAGLPKPV